MRCAAAFALQRRLKSPRIFQVIDYGPRWQMHQLRIQKGADLDDELRTWLKQAHDVVGMQKNMEREFTTASDYDN